MGAEDAIYYNFQHLYIDDYKAEINNDMEQSSNWSYDHFGLSQSDHGHILPTLGIVTCSISFGT